MLDSVEELVSQREPKPVPIALLFTCCKVSADRDFAFVAIPAGTSENNWITVVRRQFVDGIGDAFILDETLDWGRWLVAAAVKAILFQNAVCDLCNPALGQ